jgi:hypothetical protein
MCSVHNCDEIATIMLHHSDQAERAMCAKHWDLTHSVANMPISIVRTLPRPTCFVRDYPDGAVAIMEHINSTLLPCCETHLNDLSWIVPDRVGAGGWS